MNDVIRFPEQTPETRAAIEWAARLDRGGLSKAESLELRNWLEGRQDRRDELIRVVEMWDDFRALLANSDIGADEGFAAELSELSRISETSKRRSVLRRGAAIAASISILAAGAAVGVDHVNYRQYTAQNATYSTLIGEQREISLPDQSVVVLNTSSSMIVQYRRGVREITLLSGEAHFNVAHRRNNAFLVKAGAGSVRAVGTAFSVKYDRSEVEVLVSDGDVVVDLLEPTDAFVNVGADNAGLRQARTTEASVGDRVVFGEKIRSVTRVEPDRLETELFWRNGVLAFEDQPLHEVISEVSRYTELEIAIVDANVRDLRVGGYFPVGKLESIFDSLRDGFGLSVEEVDEGVFHISRDVS